MHAAVAAAHAERERAVAEGTRDARRAELTEAEAAAARANADVLNHAAEHSLPSDRRGATTPSRRCTASQRRFPT